MMDDLPFDDSSDVAHDDDDFVERTPSHAVPVPPSDSSHSDQDDTVDTEHATPKLETILPKLHAADKHVEITYDVFQDLLVKASP